VSTPATDTAAATTESVEPSRSGDALLRVTGLKKHFPITQGVLFQRQIGAVKAVDGISFDVRKGETLGLVGESGCGKSTAGRVITKLLDPTGGTIEFDGEHIESYSRSKMRPLRRDMQIIFQDPYSSLNPRHTIGTIIGAPYRIQGIETDASIKTEVQGLMERVGLNPEHYNRYPHEFSGGQRQRIGVARAIALRPRLIICDEPVSALDVSIQAQVVNLLEDLQSEFGLAYIFIAHDLSVVRHISDRVAVMYLGKIMELTNRDELYAAPLHPYTHALMSAVPIPDPDSVLKRERILLSGDLPSPINPPPGCVFHTRCWRAEDRCRVEIPLVREIKPEHYIACHFPEERSILTPGPEIHGPTPAEPAEIEGNEPMQDVVDRPKWGRTPF
jgi:peptide/nickel transport system ATP-binding protein